MRFRMSSRPPAHLDRRLQWRLLGVVALIAAAMFAYQTFRVVQQRSERTAATSVSPDSLDFSVQPDANGPLAPDEFRAAPVRPARSSVANTDSTPIALDKSVLETVRDNTLGIRHDEADAFYAVLDHVGSAAPQQLEQSARKDVLYVNLMTESAKYRGEVVTIVGDMWRCYELPQSRNAGQTLYEAWVFTSDSGTHPYRIVASDLGAGLKAGENLRSPVRVTGCFFKREGYDTPGGLHVAPTILAKSIAAYRSPQGPPPADDLTPIMLSVVVAIGLILAVTFLSFAWGDRRGPQRRAEWKALRSFDAAEMEGVDHRSVGEALRELSERDRWAASAANHAAGNGRASSNGAPTP
jgi:hypothetical protein